MGIAALNWVRFVIAARSPIYVMNERAVLFGQVGERLKPTDCKSVPPCEVRRFESFPVHHELLNRSSQAVVAQLVERVLGKDEVTGSIPVNGSIPSPDEDCSRAGRILEPARFAWT